MTHSCVQTTTLSCHVWFEKVSMSVSDVYQYSTSTLSYFDSLASVDFGGDSSCPEIESVHNNSEVILAPDWSRLITWPEYWPVIGPDSDWFSQLSLSDLARQAKQLQTAGYLSSLATTAFSLLLSLLWGEDSRLTTEVKSLSRLLSRIPVGFSRPFLIGAKQETDYDREHHKVQMHKLRRFSSFFYKILQKGSVLLSTLYTTLINIH